MEKVQQFLVVDDHETVLAGTLPALQQAYPQANIATAQTARAAEQQIAQQPPDFIVLDLVLPRTLRSAATTETGLQLLRGLMEGPQPPNIMVLSINVMPLVRIKSAIYNYEGGFVAIDKSLPIEDMVHSVDMALRGSINLPPAIRSRPEFDARWLQVLQLKYHRGLSDVAIAQAMGISDRTVRNYWVRIQDALEIHESPQNDTRSQIQLVARKAGLID